MPTGLWARIEKTVRDLAERDGQVFVVTGPIFADSAVVPDGRVQVPSETFKAIDDPKGKILGAYVADNSADGKYQVVSVAKLDALIGLDVFPSLQTIRTKGRQACDPEGTGNLPPTAERGVHGRKPTLRALAWSLSEHVRASRSAGRRCRRQSRRRLARGRLSDAQPPKHKSGPALESAFLQ